MFRAPKDLLFTTTHRQGLDAAVRHTLSDHRLAGDQRVEEKTAKMKARWRTGTPEQFTGRMSDAMTLQHHQFAGSTDSRSIQRNDPPKL